jgi:hypothetical protein
VVGSEVMPNINVAVNNALICIIGGTKVLDELLKLSSFRFWESVDCGMYLQKIQKQVSVMAIEYCPPTSSP